MKLTFESEHRQRSREAADHVEIRGNSISGSGNSKYKGPGQECGALGILGLRNKTQATEANAEQAPGRQADRKPRFQAGPKACRAPCQGLFILLLLRTFGKHRQGPRKTSYL